MLATWCVEHPAVRLAAVCSPVAGTPRQPLLSLTPPSQPAKIATVRLEQEAEGRLRSSASHLHGWRGARLTLQFAQVLTHPLDLACKRITKPETFDTLKKARTAERQMPRPAAFLSTVPCGPRALCSPAARR